MSNQCETLEHFCFAQTWNRPVSIGKIGSVRYNNFYYFEISVEDGSCFTQYSGKVDVSTVSNASGLCKCSIKVPFVVWELTVNNNNNNDILIHFLQRKIFNLQMHRLLVHLDTCIRFCLLFFWHALDCLFIPPLFVQTIKDARHVTSYCVLHNKQTGTD